MSFMVIGRCQVPELELEAPPSCAVEKVGTFILCTNQSAHKTILCIVLVIK